MVMFISSFLIFQVIGKYYFWIQEIWRDFRFLFQDRSMIYPSLVLVPMKKNMIKDNELVDFSSFLTSMEPHLERNLFTGSVGVYYFLFTVFLNIEFEKENIIVLTKIFQQKTRI